jgi:hypothetical protein
MKPRIFAEVFRRDEIEAPALDNPLRATVNNEFAVS